MRTLILFLAALPLLARDDETAAGHSAHGEAFNEGPRQHAYLIPGMGSVAFPVTTRQSASPRSNISSISVFSGMAANGAECFTSMSASKVTRWAPI